MGLRHFGQVGGGVFLGMTLTLDQARAQNSLSPLNAEVGAVIGKVYNMETISVCPVPDSPPYVRCSERFCSPPLKAGMHNAAELNNAGGVGKNPDSAIPR
jgi:hypothetical protein